MKDSGSNDLGTVFEDRVREWGLRPPRTSASLARTRIVARLPRASRSSVSWRLAAAAALLLILIVAVWRGSPRPAGVVAAKPLASFVPSLDPNVVVWVIDSRTTVYFVLDKEAPTEGGVS